MVYVKDKITGRVYGVVIEAATLLLADAEHPSRPAVAIRLADLYLEDRFVEVASTHDS